MLVKRLINSWIREQSDLKTGLAYPVIFPSAEGYRRLFKNRPQTFGYLCGISSPSTIRVRVAHYDKKKHKQVVRKTPRIFWVGFWEV